MSVSYGFYTNKEQALSDLEEYFLDPEEWHTCFGSYPWSYAPDCNIYYLFRTSQCVDDLIYDINKYSNIKVNIVYDKKLMYHSKYDEDVLEENENGYRYIMCEIVLSGYTKYSKLVTGLAVLTLLRYADYNYFGGYYGNIHSVIEQNNSNSRPEKALSYIPITKEYIDTLDNVDLMNDIFKDAVFTMWPYHNVSATLAPVQSFGVSAIWQAMIDYNNGSIKYVKENR